MVFRLATATVEYRYFNYDGKDVVDEVLSTLDNEQIRAIPAEVFRYVHNIMDISKNAGRLTVPQLAYAISSAGEGFNELPKIFFMKNLHRIQKEYYSKFPQLKGRGGGLML